MGDDGNPRANELALTPSTLAVGHVAEVASDLPELIDACGNGARFAYEEFFHGRLRNPHTRKNYRLAVHRFLGWCRNHGLDLHQIAPKHVGQYLDELPLSVATKKVHLPALRHFFDELVVRHVVVLNPAASVRGERYEVIEGKTPEISAKQARLLLRSIDTDNVVGLRDRSIIGILIYTAARIGAVAKLRREHYYDDGEQFYLRFAEKSGKSREIPVRHDLRAIVHEYLAAGGLATAETGTPLFRTAVGRTKQLTRSAMTPGDMGRMVKRRMRDAGLPGRLSPHSFRVATITDLLEQGVPLQDVQHLVGHSDPRTTRLYDRRHKRITRNIVERISI
jgi:site-specific recombinase XerD